MVRSGDVILMKIIFALLIPFMIAGINETLKKQEGRVLVRNLLITVFLSNLGMCGAYLLFKERCSRYEILLVNAMLAVVIDLFLIPTIENRKLKQKDVLVTTCMISCCAVVYSILTYGQTVIHSDVATATILSESILKNHTLFPKTWNYVNGDIWVISNALFTILPTKLMSNQSLARMVGSLIFVVLTTIGIVYQSRKSFKNDSWTVSIPILMVHMFACADLLLFQAAYTGQLLWLALCSTLLYEIYRCERLRDCKKYVIIYFILMVLLLMGGMRLLAEQTVPALCAVLLIMYFKIREDEKIEWKTVIKKLVVMTLVIMIPSAIGYGIYKWLCVGCNMANAGQTQIAFVENLVSVWNNLSTMIVSLFENFGYNPYASLISVGGIRNFISVILCGMTCFIVPFLQGRKLKEETDAVKFFYWFSMSHNLVMILMAVFFGTTYPRYMSTAVFAFVLLSSRYIYVYWINQKNFRQVIWTGLFTFATAVGVIGLVFSSKGWQDTLANCKAFNQELMSRGLTKGYASYWNAYNNEIYSDLGIKYGGIQIYPEGMLPFYWLVDSDTFTPEDKKTFLMLSEEEKAVINDKLFEICGNPIDEFVLNNMHVFVFDHDIAVHMNIK